jgi:hypothetical protein
MEPRPKMMIGNYDDDEVWMDVGEGKGKDTEWWRQWK